MRTMFDRVAPVYDLMNSVMTAGTDARWRAATVRALDLRPGMRVLDVACGTGGLARGAAAAVGPHGSVAGVDLSGRMLIVARRRRVSAAHAAVVYHRADALALPFEDATFDAACIGFGLRNVADHAACLREMARVVRPGGRIAVLELAEPPGGLARAVHRTWFRRVVPLLGRLLGRRAAYAYLPASVARYPGPERVAALMAAAGLGRPRWRYLPTGMATLHVGRRAPASTGG